MIITYHGGYFVKISQGDTVIVANPFGKGSLRKPIRFGARVALVSMDHPDMNGAENFSHGDKIPFVVSGPGEYEVGGIAISGFLSPARSKSDAGGPQPVGDPPASDSGRAGKKLLNTIYAVELEGIRLCFLGALSSPALSPEVIEGIGEVDVLFVPVSGGDVPARASTHAGGLLPADAEKIAVSLDAKLVIPLGWDEGGDPPASDFGRAGKQLKLFLKEAGAESTKPLDKLTLKKKDLEGKEGDVVVLEALSHA
ncbi:MAG TPA: MBL fold metallo-hydrolase [Candidatus Paceibacterota bacterium]